MSRCRVAIVADDLTGALDAAAPFAARGARARVVIALEHLETCLEAFCAERLEGERNGVPQVIAVNTESRHLSAEEAAARVAEATALLARLSPAVWFKKVDSTLRGQVLAESVAMMEATGRNLLVAPAVPAQGREVRNAEVWVEGAPLAATAYAADGRSRTLQGPLDAAFASAGVAMERWLAPLGRDLPDGHCVVDASTQQELALLCDILSRRPERWLLVGAAGLATAIAQRCFGLMRGAASPLSGISRCLFVVGSRSPRAQEQCRQLREHASTLSVESVLEAAPGAEGAAMRLLVPGGQPGEIRSPEEVARAMGERVAAIEREWSGAETRLLFLTGGDIAMAALSRLGGRFIEVKAEWRPGIALGDLDGDPRRRVMTKAGGFGDAALLLHLHDEIAGPEISETGFARLT
jgi:uncharacterized protein YgbK (DUF1537 family)